MMMDKYKWFKKTGYTPHEGQKAMHDSDARFRLIVAGRQWGKTLSATKEAEVMLLEPDTKGWVVAETYDMVMNTLSALRRDLEDVGKSPCKGYIQDLMLEYPWGSTVEGKIAQHPETMLGAIELDWVVFDECAMCSEEVWRIIHLALDRRIMVDQSWWKRVLQRILPWWFRKPPGKAVLVTTPRGYDSWVYHAWRKGQDPLLTDWWSGHGTTADNPSIPDDYIEIMRQTLDDETFRKWFEGKFIPKKDPYYDETLVQKAKEVYSRLEKRKDDDDG